MAALVTDSGRKTPARLAGSAVLALQSDERLVKLVRSGHERAFDAIVERYRKQLVRFCSRILPESRTEDAVQQAFLNAHTALTSSDDAVQLKPWLYAITRNAALNMYRQNGWNHDQIPPDFDGVRRPDQVVEQRFELQQTVAALGDLPERQRDALVMREFEGRSYGEIAAVLGTGDGAVRQLLNRARVTLRSAASALIPPPLVVRAASMPPSDGRRIAELLGGVGAAGIAKAGATALVAGTLVVGAVNAPLSVVSRDTPTREKATLTAGQPGTKARAASTPAVAARTVALGRRSTSAHGGSSGSGESRHGSSHSGSSHSGSGGPGPSNSGSENRSGSSHSGSSDRSGSDDSTRSGSGDGSRSGSDNHSGTSGGSGSDDTVASLTETNTSNTSGTGDSGSGGSSGSGTTDSGSSGSSDSGTSGSSGSNDSTSSGSSTPSTDGSGTSGTSDLITH